MNYETMKGRTAAELLGEMEPPKVGRDRLIVSAIDLCYRNGFHAVGLDQIIAHAGVTKTTFYKHFESRDDLLIAAIKKRDEWELKAWKRAIDEIGGDSMQQQLLAIYDLLDAWFNEPIYGGCMFINAASEFPNPSDPIHQAAAQHKIHFRQWVDEIAEQAELEDPKGFTDTYIMLLEGALVLRQVYGQNDAARKAKQRVIQIMSMHGVPLNPPETVKQLSGH
ncbi:MAG: TetR/AcrR family transcriptional regulator [Planctomycetota bacterium]